MKLVELAKRHVENLESAIVNVKQQGGELKARLVELDKQRAALEADLELWEKAINE